MKPRIIQLRFLAPFVLIQIPWHENKFSEGKIKILVSQKQTLKMSSRIPFGL